MKTLDSRSKRMFMVALSICLVLLSLSVFSMSLQRVNAQVASDNPLTIPHLIGLGIGDKEVPNVNWEDGRYIYQTNAKVQAHQREINL